MADNQFDWIVRIRCGLEALFRDRPDVFVVGELLWHPVEGNNVIRAAPDAMVAFGRPPGPRGWYVALARAREEAEARRAEAERRRDEAEREREAASRRAEALAAGLRQLGVDPDTLPPAAAF
jgi:hypothetical protein